MTGRVWWLNSWTHWGRARLNSVNPSCLRAQWTPSSVFCEERHIGVVRKHLSNQHASKVEPEAITRYDCTDITGRAACLLETTGQMSDGTMATCDAQRLGVQHGCRYGLLLSNGQSQKTTEAGVDGGGREVLKGQPGRAEQGPDVFQRQIVCGR